MTTKEIGGFKCWKAFRCLPMVVKSTSSRLSSMLSMLVRNLLNVEESISSSWVNLGSYAFRFFCFSFIFIFLATTGQKDNVCIYVFMYLYLCWMLDFSFYSGVNAMVFNHWMFLYLDTRNLLFKFNMTNARQSTMHFAGVHTHFKSGKTHHWSSSSFKTDLHSCSVVVNPRQMSPGSGSLSLVGYPCARFFDVPLSRGAPFLHVPRFCLCLDADAFLQLHRYTITKIRNTKEINNKPDKHWHS